jgi:hypothetical protein
MTVPEYLYSHSLTCDEDGREGFRTDRYRVLRVTKKRVFVERRPEGQGTPEDGAFSFSREAIEAGEVVGARGEVLLTSNPDPRSYWQAMSRAVLAEGRTKGPIVA